MTRPEKINIRLAVSAGAMLILLAAMALDTKVVKIGSTEGAPAGQFSAASYGASEFPKVQSALESRAVPVDVLAAALAGDQAAAEAKYGIATPAGPEFAVKFTGKVGKSDSGVYDVAAPGMPDTVHLTVQTGPAINGTDLRDASGLIKFGDFSNQIDYQNAGAALNNAMKQAVLSKLDTSDLTGKTISVIGAFQPADPDEWLVTPAQLSVQ